MYFEDDDYCKGVVMCVDVLDWVDLVVSVKGDWVVFECLYWCYF